MSGEMGPHNIRVNAICPGIVMTSRLDDLSEEQWRGIIDNYIPLKRAGTPSDIGNMVAYLCSDQGSWISGQLYSVDGGQLAGR
jgi:NAD(P)-dependent dehydrogenase (short-subunit alcohol dehydrogenase family)